MTVGHSLKLAICKWYMSITLHADFTPITCKPKIKGQNLNIFISYSNTTQDDWFDVLFIKICPLISQINVDYMSITCRLHVDYMTIIVDYSQLQSIKCRLQSITVDYTRNLKCHNFFIFGPTLKIRWLLESLKKTLNSYTGPEPEKLLDLMSITRVWT